MEGSRSHRSEVLELIRQTRDLLDGESVVFSSKEDCDFFRLAYRKNREAVTPIKSSPPKRDEALHEKDQQPRPTLEPRGRSSCLGINLHSPESAAKDQAAQTPSWGGVSLEEIVAKAVPSLTICREIPSDRKARVIAERWRMQGQAVPFILLSFRESAQQKELLEHLSEAIETVFGHSRLAAAEDIEEQDQWQTFLSTPELKLLALCETSLHRMPRLLRFYREIPNQSEKFLGNVPLISLPDLTFCIERPLLKRTLWEVVCQQIALRLPPM